MSKSRYAQWDREMAEELGLELSPFVLVLKHVQQLKCASGGFCFVYLENGCLVYDCTPLWGDTLGVRQKPERFLMPPRVARQLQENRYERWYFYNRQMLFPLQRCKTEKFLQSFWFVKDDDSNHRSNVVFREPTDFRRKRALQVVTRPIVTWQSVIPPLPECPTGTDYR